MEVGINVEGGIFLVNTSTYVNAINEEWRREKSKKSINVVGGNVHGVWRFLIKINKCDFTFIREMRVKTGRAKRSQFQIQHF